MVKALGFYDETYIIEEAKAKRKCSTCKKTIQPKETCLKHLQKGTLPDCRVIWIKKNLCRTCGQKELNTFTTRVNKFLECLVS